MQSPFAKTALLLTLMLSDVRAIEAEGLFQPFGHLRSGTTRWFSEGHLSNPPANSTAASLGADLARLNNTYVGNYGAEITDFKVIGADQTHHGGIEAETAPSNRVADDINGNGYRGTTQIRADLDGDGVVGSNEVIAIINNFGNLYTFNVSYDTVTVRHATTPTSFEVMKQHVLFAPEGMNTLRTGWRFDGFFDQWSLGFGDEVRGGWEINPSAIESLRYGWLRESLEATTVSAYTTTGLRAMRIEDDFFFEGIGSILGRTSVSTMVDHDIIGPQLGVGVVAEASMFRFEAVVLGLVGYGHAETKQTGIFGQELVPGALNRSATARATHSSPKVTDDYVAWQGETRLTASCQLTQSLRFDAMWRGVLTGPVRNAAIATAWNAPDFGIHDMNGETIDFSHWFFGLTYTR